MTERAGLRTVGVEEELLLVDIIDLAPLPVAEHAIAAAGQDPNGHRLDAEMKLEQIEAVSPPQSSFAGVLDGIRHGRRLADEAAGLVGARAVAVATVPTVFVPHLASGARYAAMAERFGIVARDQFTCGLHVHVSIDSAEEGVAILDRIRTWLPILLAFSSNSPLRNGTDTGFHSYRYQAWGCWPTAGPTELLGDPQTYRRLVDAMVAAGVLMDEGMVYFDARLSRHHPTVEVRISDVPLHAEHSAVIAVLTRALVETAAREWRDGIAPSPTPRTLLEAASWAASKDGLTGCLVDPTTGVLRPAHEVVATFLDHVGAVLEENGERELATSALGEALRHGTGADRQRLVWRQTGDAAAVIADALAATHATPAAQPLSLA